MAGLSCSICLAGGGPGSTQKRPLWMYSDLGEGGGLGGGIGQKEPLGAGERSKTAKHQPRSVCVEADKVIDQYW